MAEPISTSVFEIFKPGIGPSSSHTMGPMTSALAFRHELVAFPQTHQITRVVVVLHGSLAATGRGHYADRAVMAGLGGCCPGTVTNEELAQAVATIRASGHLSINDHQISFDEKRDLRWCPDTPDLPHPNTLDFVAFDRQGSEQLRRRYLSVGGGFVELLSPDGTRQPLPLTATARAAGPHRYTSGKEVLELCRRHKISWHQVMLENEVMASGQSDVVVRGRLQDIWKAMRNCITQGIRSEGLLPGPLNVHRRAARAYATAMEPDRQHQHLQGHLELLAHAYALAVNEENAAGHRVVTAPTNGAAGVIPACFAAAQDTRHLSDEHITRGLLTAGLLGTLIKARASLSGAEMGCQGEVGSAAAMAAGGLVDMYGGTPEQVEMAAEIAIEHHLGLTCDPVGGLVQIPCIERNVMGAVKAISAASLALASDGQHRVSLDESLAAMAEIGHNMSAKYRETSQGGLALAASRVSHVEC